MDTRSIAVAVLILPLLAGFIPAASAQSEATVVVSPVETARERLTIQTVGQSRALRSATLQADTSGRVSAVLIEPDTRVAAGAPLLRLEDRAERIAVALAEVRLADAERLLARYTRADGTGAFAPTTVDAARREVELAELELARARVDLAERTLRAPFAGYTGLTDIDAGDRVSEETVITTLDDRRRLRLRFRIAERHYGQLRVGDAVDVKPWSDTATLRKARITRIDSRIDTATGTFRAEALVDNADDALRPGMRFAVQAEVTGPLYYRLPDTALLWGDDGAYTWRIAEGRAERVALQLIRREPSHVLVDGPLAEGESVVSEGVQRLRPGRRVRILEADALDDHSPLEARRIRQADP